MASTARYAESSDGMHIAYIVEGEGPLDLVWVPPWISQVEYLWTEPTLRAALDQMTAFARVITFDRRGAGLSDPLLRVPTLEEQMDDVLAVMDAAGSERAAVAASIEAGPMAAMFAATHPERTGALVLSGTFARSTWAEDYPFAWTREERRAQGIETLAHWGEGRTVMRVAPSRVGDPAFREWAGRLERLAASPATARRIFELQEGVDVRDVLPSIRVPTLVLNRRGDTAVNPDHSRYLAEHIAGARHVELEGADNMFSVGDPGEVVGEIQEFLTGSRPEREPDRMLATVLFTDIVDSTRRAATVGDRVWRETLERHDDLMRRAIERHRGREIKHTGDGFLATFDGPARGIRCAASVAEAMGSLGIEVRAGLHTGECEVMDGDLGGLAVHIAARVMDAAGAGEVLVSSTVKDLVVGSELDFHDRGPRELRGVPGEWRLFSVR
ncbi:MAG TPA: adenylate/guanylate cyclase domain-containing protein [Thermoleophilaceae bacterium]